LDTPAGLSAVRLKLVRQATDFGPQPFNLPPLHTRQARAVSVASVDAVEGQPLDLGLQGFYAISGFGAIGVVQARL
jgi:hypothetical protein